MTKVMTAPKKEETFRVSGISLPVSPKQAGDSLMEIYQKNNNQLTPKAVLEEAKSVSHPLHKCFEWDDKKAGKAYRLTQASKIIRCVVVTKQDSSGKIMPVRAFVSIKEEEGGSLTVNPFTPFKSYYVSVDDAMGDTDLRKYTVDVALLDLQNWMARYDSVKELAGLFATMEKQIARLKKSKAKKKSVKKKVVAKKKATKKKKK